MKVSSQTEGAMKTMTTDQCQKTRPDSCQRAQHSWGGTQETKNLADAPCVERNHLCLFISNQISE